MAALAAVASLLLAAVAVYNLLPLWGPSSLHPTASSSLQLSPAESCSDPCKYANPSTRSVFDVLTAVIKTSPLLAFVRILLVESIPQGLDFNSSTTHPSIYQAWLNLMAEARSSVDIASFYWTLTNEDTGTHETTADQVSAASPSSRL